MNKIKDLFKAHYDFHKETVDEDKYSWAASEVFDLVTYDSRLDERFVKDILEVLKVIQKRQTFDYIRDGANYVKYILVCQLLRDFQWIDWGTSIRGAWFDFVGERRDIVKDQAWSEWNPVLRTLKDHVLEAIPATEENIAAFIEFMEE